MKQFCFIFGILVCSSAFAADVLPKYRLNQRVEIRFVGENVFYSGCSKQGVLRELITCCKDTSYVVRIGCFDGQDHWISVDEIDILKVVE